jgi:ribosome-binding ATPase YchF (GTP1/OBG family)
VRERHLLTDKSVFYVANVAESALTNLDAAPELTALRQAAAAEHATVVPLCASVEAELAGCVRRGKLAIQGREYVVRDGDVMYFRFKV